MFEWTSLTTVFAIVAAVLVVPPIMFLFGWRADFLAGKSPEVERLSADLEERRTPEQRLQRVMEEERDEYAEQLAQKQEQEKTQADEALNKRHQELTNAVLQKWIDYLIAVERPSLGEVVFDELDLSPEKLAEYSAIRNLLPRLVESEGFILSRVVDENLELGHRDLKIFQFISRLDAETKERMVQKVFAHLEAKRKEGGGLVSPQSNTEKSK